MISLSCVTCLFGYIIHHEGTIKISEMKEDESKEKENEWISKKVFTY